MSVVITGVAGFVGVNLTRALLKSGVRVVGIDNLSRGTRNNIQEFQSDQRFEFLHLDLNDLDAVMDALITRHKADSVAEIWHLAANSDIPAGIADANIDLNDTFLTTFNTLEVMKRLDIPVLAFASSSAIYGDHQDVAFYEDMGPLLPISNYGAMKLASEAIISAAAESYLEKAFIFRFPNVIGTPATHGVVYDFVGKLHKDPSRLDVLGNGSQQKSYLHVEDLVDAMIFVRDHSREKLSYFNIGSDDDGITVKFIAEEVVRVVSPSASIRFGESNRGWVGDVPRFKYSIDKLRKLGWKPRWNSEESMKRAIKEISQELS